MARRSHQTRVGKSGSISTWAHNPHIKYGRGNRRGYAMVELSPARATVHFQGLDDVHRAESGVSTLARVVVHDGMPGVARSA